MDGVDGADGVGGVEFAIGLEEFDVFFGEVAVKGPVAGVLARAKAFKTIGLFIFGSVCLWSFVGG